MKVSMIAAVAENRVIGKDNDLAWNLPIDMKYFVDTTRGHHVIMGRKNYQSIPKKFRPLPNRPNIVVTRQENFQAPGCQITNTLGKALDIARRSGEKEAFIIGGGEIYALGLPLSDRLYITEVKAIIEGDVFFPSFDKSQWNETSRKSHNADDRHDFPFDFVVWDRNVTIGIP